MKKTLLLFILLFMFYNISNAQIKRHHYVMLIIQKYILYTDENHEHKFMYDNEGNKIATITEALQVMENRGYTYMDSYPMASGIAGINFLHILIRKELKEGEEIPDSIGSPIGRKKQRK